MFEINAESDRPILLPRSEEISRAIKVLDCYPPYDTHKIGVIYIDEGQCHDQTAILSNQYGSPRYMKFLSGLGNLINLRSVDKEQVYVGGLETSGADGKFAYVWHDDVMQVVFHVATLMPNKASDEKCNSKKLHVGNDYVYIVYNNSGGGPGGQQFNMSTIKGAVNSAAIIIEPMSEESNLVSVVGRPNITAMLGYDEVKIISDRYAPLLVRQMALHANLASMIVDRESRGRRDMYVSNWLERLRQVKKIRAKVISSQHPTNGNHGDVAAAGSADAGGNAGNGMAHSPTHSHDTSVDFTQYV